MPAACPSTEHLATVLRERQPSAVEAELAAHLGECPACQERLQTLAGEAPWLEACARRPGAAANPPSPSLQNAMRTLASRGELGDAELAAPPRLDFLQPSGQPGALGRFGPYEVLAVVAVGGMGIVLKAHDPGLDRIVALKLLPPALAASPLPRARFIREARAAAAVAHEHVVPIYAVDACAGLPYLVMQFVDGPTLAERMKAAGPLPLEDILRIGAQTAAGLAAAHAQGLIHRDVKPGNILLENAVERVKITDFGLARAMGDSSLTHAGHLAGTPEYMSPEQANDGIVDARSDLFGLGCVLYQMATGVSPFRAAKPLAALRRVCEEEPPPAHTVNPRIPEWLARIIQRLMAKEAARRPPSAAEVAAELAQGLAQTQQGPVTGWPMPDPRVAPPEPPKPRPWTRLAGLLALALTITLLAVLIPRHPSSAEPLKPESPAISPNALFVVPAFGDGPARGFATLAAALAAATNPAVVECRFNGVHAVETVFDIRQPLILRAAPGFEPVLTPADRNAALLIARAPLVLEGLTVVTHPRPPDSDGGGPGSLSAGIVVEGAPFLAAHCRFEIDSPASFPRRRPKNLHLLDVPDVRLRHCEFAGPSGLAIEWTAGQPLAPGQTVRLEVESCRAHGSFLSLGGQRLVPAQLALHRSTFQGKRFLTLIGERPDNPILVTASQNLFAVDELLWAYRAQEAPLERLLRWQGGSNVYDVKSYAAINPPITRPEDWQAGAAIAEVDSAAAALGLTARIDRLADRSRTAEASALSLMPDERDRLAALGGAALAQVGADPARTGPGQPYHQWRASPGYQEWLTHVRQRLSETPAGR